ncbi:MAG: DUF2283 domain-containing protein [Chloroflexi bacterium]|nr:DUF2283 domain-containing protein [Chloroflexota bacterium]
MRISYDPQVDAMYIRFAAEPAQCLTLRLNEDVAINHTADGRIVGIEILGASEYVAGPGEEPHVVLENLLAVTTTT